MWANAVANRNEFQEADKVVVRGRFDINPSSGKFQFSIQQIKKVGLGDLYAQLEELRQKLRAEGVIDEIIKALSDDLNTPKVLSLLAEWSSTTLSGAKGGSASEFREVLDALLGLKF